MFSIPFFISIVICLSGLMVLPTSVLAKKGVVTKLNLFALLAKTGGALVSIADSHDVKL